MHCARFAGHALDQHAYRHSTGERVRVDDHVGLHAALAERHINRRPLLRADTLLPVARGELVADNRRPCYPKRDVHFLQLAIAVVITYENQYQKGERRERLAHRSYEQRRHRQFRRPCT